MGHALRGSSFRQDRGTPLQAGRRAGHCPSQKEIDSIASNPAAPDFENTIAALDRSGETLDRVYTTFSLVAAADNNRRCSRPIWKYRRR
ncbi:MAG: hypothetical protein ACLR76_02295 [Alistipes sp.]